MNYSEQVRDRWRAAKDRAKQAREDVVDRLTSAGHEVPVGWGGGYLEIDGQVVWAAIKPEGTDSWRMPSGKIRCVVGSYGDSKQFPERKDYDSWISAIAAELIERAENSRRLSEHRARRAKALAAAELDIEELRRVAKGDDVRFDITPTCDDDYVVRNVSIQVSWGIDRQLSLKEAKTYMQELRALARKYSDKP